MNTQIDRQKEIPGLTKPADFFPDGRTHATKGLYGMYRAGRALTFTLETGVAKMISVFKRSTTPYVDGSLPSRHRENVKRVGSFLLGGGLTIIGIAPAILGLFCVSFSNIFRKDFTVVAPKNPSPLASELPKSIQEQGFRIVSFNVAGLPPIIQPLNHMRPFEERLEELIEYFLSLDCDCICLQELFDENAIHAIMTCEPLREKFPYMILGAGRQTFGVNSGLAILSRYPIEEPEFRAYTELNDEDVYSKKGILASRIRVSESDEFVVFNTHTQSGHQPKDVQARKVAFQGFAQFEEAFTPTGQKIRTDANGKQVKLHASFAVGDFNTCPYFANGTRNDEWDSPELVEFFKTRHARIPCDGRAVDPNALQGKEAMLATHWLRETPYTGWDISKVALWQKERKELDHMLISLVHAHDIEQAEVHVDERATCSDHIPILGTFKPKAS